MLYVKQSDSKRALLYELIGTKIIIIINKVE
jgi:hypothetical protein